VITDVSQPACVQEPRSDARRPRRPGAEQRGVSGAGRPTARGWHGRRCAARAVGLLHAGPARLDTPVRDRLLGNRADAFKTPLTARPLSTVAPATPRALPPRSAHPSSRRNRHQQLRRQHPPRAARDHPRLHRGPRHRIATQAGQRQRHDSRVELPIRASRTVSHRHRPGQRLEDPRTCAIASGRSGSAGMLPGVGHNPRLGSTRVPFALLEVKQVGRWHERLDQLPDVVVELVTDPSHDL